MPRPLEPVSQGTRVTLGISFFVLFVAAWAFATLGGFVSRTFLADPITMLQDGWLLLTRFGFLSDIGVTLTGGSGLRPGVDRGIIVVGGMLQLSGGIDSPVTLLGAAAVLLATINMVGGFLVTQRMLRMFRR